MNWGFEHGFAGGRYSPREFCQRARAAGYRWITMEWNDYNNAPRSDEVRAACEAEGLIYTIWMTRNFTAAEALQACVESGCAGFLAEGEIPAESAPGTPNPQAQNWPELVFTLEDLDIYKGVVTNFAPFTHNDGSPYPAKAQVLIDAGWSCHTECYDIDGDPTQWIDRRAFFAGQVGWATTQPVLGVYGGRTFADFPTRNQHANWSVWAAEYVL